MLAQCQLAAVSHPFREESFFDGSEIPVVDTFGNVSHDFFSSRMHKRYGNRPVM